MCGECVDVARTGATLYSLRNADRAAEPGLLMLLPPLALALTIAAGSHAAPPAPAAPSSASIQPGNARAAMIGEWRVLGPASQAHLAQMIRLTMRAMPPAAADFEAARLDRDQAAQVLAGRDRLLKEPQSPSVQGLKADWIQLDSARASITADAMALRFGATTESFTYTVQGDEGVRVQTRVKSAEGEQDVLFTVVDANTLMFGPMGAEPTVLYRASAP